MVIHQLLTIFQNIKCGWWATLTLTQCNKVGSVLFESRQRNKIEMSIIFFSLAGELLATLSYGPLRLKWLVILNPASEKIISDLFYLCMDKCFQKSAPPTFLHYARVRAVHQPHVLNLITTANKIGTPIGRCLLGWHTNEFPVCLLIETLLTWLNFPPLM